MLPTSKRWFPFFQKCRPTLYQIMAIKGLGQDLFSLMPVSSSHLISMQNQVQHPLYPLKGKGCVPGNFFSEMVGKRFKFCPGDQIIDQTHLFGTPGVIDAAREENFFCLR